MDGNGLIAVPQTFRRQMMKRFVSRTVIGNAGLLLLSVLSTATSFASDSDDDEAEHKAFLVSSVRLVDAVAAAEAHTGARAMMAEFEKENGDYIFEVELLTDKGTELEAHVDASTGAVLQVEREEDEANDDDDDE